MTAPNPRLVLLVIIDKRERLRVVDDDEVVVYVSESGELPVDRFVNLLSSYR